MCILMLLVGSVVHADLHDNIWRDGKEYGDADTIEIDDDGGYYVGDNVEEALQEIGDGTALDDRYVNVTGDTMTGGLTGTTIKMDSFTDGTATLTGGNLTTTGAITSNSLTATTIVQAEQLTTTDDLNVADDTNITSTGKVIFDAP